MKTKQEKQQPNYIRQLLVKIRQRQLVLARAGRFRESNQFARWAQRVRAVAAGFEAGPVEMEASRGCGGC